MKKIVIASNNPGKLREFADLLKPFDFTTVPQTALGVTEADEPHAVGAGLFLFADDIDWEAGTLVDAED